MLATGPGWGETGGGTSARLGRWSSMKRAVLWSDNSTFSLLLLDCTCFLQPEEFFLLSRKVLLNSWISWKCSHLSLSWTGLNTHSSALNPSLKHAIKSNTFLVNKLIYKQFYSRATCQNYLVNKTSIFTLNIGQLLGRISNPSSCRATSQTPSGISHIVVHSITTVFGFFFNTRTLGSLTLQLSSSKWLHFKWAEGHSSENIHRGDDIFHVLTNEAPIFACSFIQLIFEWLLC